MKGLLLSFAVLCAFLMLVSPLVAAENISIEPISVGNIGEYENIIREFYSVAMTQYGDLLGGFIGNERMNIYIEGLDSPIYAVTENKEPKEIGAGELSDQTMNIYSDIGTLTDIGLGKVQALDAVKQGKIRFEGVGFMSILKVIFAQITLFFYSLFGGA
ncbi:MAG: hypothetical protein JW754_03300 [Candidatus Aenigmarchaeota archaeon]|nr:hypothetical protein [Candidatus Aenigmarchaeota archaeon]